MGSQGKTPKCAHAFCRPHLSLPMGKSSPNGLSGICPPLPFLKSLPEGGCVAEGQSCGMLEENILSIFPNIPTMDQCNLLCQDTPNCAFATHFWLRELSILE